MLSKHDYRSINIFGSLKLYALTTNNYKHESEYYLAIIQFKNS